MSQRGRSLLGSVFDSTRIRGLDVVAQKSANLVIRRGYDYDGHHILKQSQYHRRYVLDLHVEPDLATYGVQLFLGGLELYDLQIVRDEQWQTDDQRHNPDEEQAAVHDKAFRGVFALVSDEVPAVESDGCYAECGHDHVGRL